MYAVIKTGGKQYKVTEGDQIVVEKLLAEAGQDVTFGDVLMLSDGDKLLVGEPMVAGACVFGEVVEQRRGKKILIFKKRQRSTYRRKKGHRQYETVVNITDVSADGSRKEVKVEEEEAPATNESEEHNSEELINATNSASSEVNESIEVVSESAKESDELVSSVNESVADKSGEEIEAANNTATSANDVADSLAESPEDLEPSNSSPEAPPAGAKEDT